MPFGDLMGPSQCCTTEEPPDTGTLPGCFCTAIPATLTMVSASHTCNFNMFQDCTIQYGPTPPEYAALSLGANTFISVESFPDPIADGALFRYLLTCSSNQMALTRIYETSPYGSPYIDGILYTWATNAPGNSCLPRSSPPVGGGPSLSLTSGVAFVGSELTCDVDIFS